MVQITTPEGYIQRSSTSNNGFEYVYNLSDHLGNIRVTYMDSNQNNTNPVNVEIVELNSYYPYGTTMEYENNLVSSYANSVARKFKYNGKEHIEELGLNIYDYHARMYDPAIGRLMQIDPHAYSYPWATPYNYAFNNPILVVDPDGKDGIVSGSGTEDDPFVVRANYYFYGLNDKQIEGLNAAVDEYNNDGKAHKIKDANGNKVYVQFNIGITEVENAEQAQESATNDYVETEDGGVASFGNVISVGGNAADNHYGNADRHNITLNQARITATLSTYEGGNEDKMIKSTFIHEIGHNIGGSHGDPGSIMKNAKFSEMRDSNKASGGGSGIYNYILPSVSKDGIRAIMGRVDMDPGSINSAYLTDKENAKVNEATNAGSTGRLKSIN